MFSQISVSVLRCLTDRPFPPHTHFQPIRLPCWKHGTSLHNDKAQRHLSRLFFPSSGWKFAATHYRLLVSPNILPVCLCLKCTFSFSLCIFISLFPLSKMDWGSLLIDISLLTSFTDEKECMEMQCDAMYKQEAVRQGAGETSSSLTNLSNLPHLFKQTMFTAFLASDPGSRGTV